MSRVIVIGASGHAKVIVDMLQQLNRIQPFYEELALLDDNEKLWNTKILGCPVLGKISDYREYADSMFVIGIGNNQLRKQIAENYKLNYISVIHPTAVVAEDVVIQNGTVVMANAVINSGSLIGSHCIINTAATVDHDGVLSDYVHLSPGAHIGGTVSLGEKVWLGLGSIVKNNVRIEEGIIIGAGGVVIKDLTASGTYVGVPVRKIK